MGGTLEVAFYWHGQLMSMEHFDRGTVRIGPSMIGKELHLARFNKGEVDLQVPASMTLHINGVLEVDRNKRLKKGDVAHIKLGNFLFILRLVERVALPPGMPIYEEQRDFLKIAATICVVYLSGIVAINLAPQPERKEDELLNNPIFVRELFVKTEEIRKKEVALLKKKEESGQRKDAEGKFGRKDKPHRDALPSAPGAPNVDKSKKERDRELALTALKNLGLNDEQAAVSDKLGPGGLGNGANKQLGGLKGSAMGDAGGAGGLGTRGGKAGGGGTALGIGGVGTGVGKGIGDLGLEGGEKTRVRVLPGKVTYEGGLRQDEIQRVINLFMNQIKYCYSKELQKNPELEGKLVANWVIASDGTIKTSSMAQNTMGNTVVEACVLRVIGRMKFPQPRGGGVVSVTYPFVFTAAGA